MGYSSRFSLHGRSDNTQFLRILYSRVNAGYCFVDLVSPEAATSAIGTLNGTVIPGTDKTFKLNWASGGNPASGGAVGSEFSVFVGDLSPEVTDYMLLVCPPSRHRQLSNYTT